MASGRILRSQKSIKIPADVVQLFEFLLEPSNTPRWVKGIDYVGHRPSGPVELGTEVACRVTAFGFLKNAKFRYVEVSRPWRFSIVGMSTGLIYRSEFKLDQAQDTRSTVLYWEIQLELPHWFALGSNLIAGVLSDDMVSNLERLDAIFTTQHDQDATD